MTTPQTDIAQDLATIAQQERDLILPTFDLNDAWQLGNLLRDLATQRNCSIVIDIRRFGNPLQPLFYAALSGTTPDNARWVERKSNTVARFHRSSYSLGLKLQLENTTLAAKYALPDAEYATHGGSFPLTVASAGILGSVTVSGLPQRADHELVVEALCLYTQHDYAAYRLP